MTELNQQQLRSEDVQAQSSSENVLEGDFARGMRTLPATNDRPDFARGARTLPPNNEGPDFARGERTLPPTPERSDYARGLRGKQGVG
jgi:hypothetical protein